MKTKEYRKKEYWKNPEKNRAKATKWRLENPDKVAIIESRRIEKRNAIRKELVDSFGGKCMLCGLVDDPIAYDFHHVNPSEKKISIASALRRSITKETWEEVDKCVLLCAICHRKVEAKIIEVEFVKGEAVPV